MNVRICMVASTYPRFDNDGAGRFNRSLAEALAAAGHEVHVLIPHDPSVRPYDTLVRVHAFRYVWPAKWSVMGYSAAMDSDRRLKWYAYALISPFLFFGTVALWRLVRRYHVDLIHAHWVIPNGPIGLVVSAIGRLPLYVSLHGSDMFFARRTVLFGAVAKSVLRRAQGITACSSDLRRGALELGAPPERTHLILWGADPAVFACPPETRELQRELGLKAGSPVILALGRMVGKKGFDVLLQAMPIVLSVHPRAQCVLVGEGPELTRLQAMAEQLGIAERVRFPGSVSWDQVPFCLALSDLVVVPSVHDEGNLDGLPTVILEAMAASRPVVASEVAGIPLVVEHGSTGLLVPERDPARLAGAICYLLENPQDRFRMGRAGRERVVRELNWDQVARRFLAMYQSVEGSR